MGEGTAVTIDTQLVNAWNNHYSVGTPVRYWRGERINNDPGTEGRTAAPAYLLQGHTAVVPIDTSRAVIALTHVEPRPLLFALSVWEPWASAFALGRKRFETRSWPICTDHPLLGGESLLVICAAKRWQRDQQVLTDSLINGGILPEDIWQRVQASLGKAVAVTAVRRCLPIETRAAGDGEQFELVGPQASEVAEELRSRGDECRGELMLGQYASGRYAWVCDRASELPEQVGVRGFQGLFTLPPGSAFAIERQWRVSLGGNTDSGFEHALRTLVWLNHWESLGSRC